MTTATRKTFEQAYADAVIPEMTDKQQTVACQIRQLHWHGERIPLGEAAELYAKICDGYNEFNADMLLKLKTEFAGVDIEVTPARESSVTVYLHIPEGKRDAVEDFVNETFHADEIDTVDHFTCLEEGEPELVGEALRIWWD